MSKKALLDKIIGDAPEGTRPTVQILLQGQMLSGALSQSEEFSDLYVLEAIMQMPDGPVIGIWFFDAGAVGAVVALQPREKPGIVVPAGAKTPAGVVT